MPTSEKTKKRTSKSRGKYSQEETKLHNDCRLFFEDFYRHRFGIDYYWQAKDAVATIRILAQIRFMVPDEIRQDNGQLFFNFSAFINLAYKTADSFLRDHFNLPFINSHFNSIYLRIKNGKQQHSNARDNEQQFFDALEQRYGGRPS